VKRIRNLLLGAGACLAALSSPALAQNEEIAIIPVTELTSSNGATVHGVSYDGRRIVFESNNNYTGENADANFEIFVYDADTRRFIQLTKTENLKDPADATKITLNVSNRVPMISGNGAHIVFASNAQLTSAPNDDGNFEIYLASLPRGSETATFVRITDTTSQIFEPGKPDLDVVKEIHTNYEPTVNSDGTVVAFISSRRLFRALENGTAAFNASLEGPNRDQMTDGNGEIFVYSVTGRQYRQVTISRDVDATENFVVKGFNSNPNLSGNGQVLAFFSGFNYPGSTGGSNLDFNSEIFIYRLQDPANTFRQLTATTGTAATPPNAAVNTLPAFVRPLDFAGTWMVFESAGDFAGMNADKTREIFLANLSGGQPAFRQVTNQATFDVTKNDFSFLPSINGAGTFITFGSTLNLVPTTPSAVTTDNADGSRDLFRYDIAASTATTPVFKQLTFTSPATFLEDQRFNTSFAHPDNTGQRVSFNYISSLLAPNSSFASEIFQLVIIPVTSSNAQAVTTSNAASFDPAQVARDSIAAAFGTMLSNSVATASTASLPFELDGVRVIVSGVAARLFYVSPGQVNFVLPGIIANSDTASIKIINNGVRSSGTVKVVTAAPGIFAAGMGQAAAACGEVLDLQFVFSEQPCNASTDTQTRYLVIFGTGWRGAAATTTVMLGDDTLTPIFAGAQGAFAGLDQINVAIPASAMGKGTLNLKVTSGTIVSNTTTVNIR
jgi:uncharacterized protein (TIGR03437 family)